jgi:hypothetical protein
MVDGHRFMGLLIFSGKHKEYGGILPGLSLYSLIKH